MKIEKTQNIKKNILQCNDLNNDILLKKYLINIDDNILLRENQLIILTENGKILDIEEENGLYKIEEGVSQKDYYLKEWKNLIIRNAEKVPLSIIFLNKSIIKQNKYNIQKLKLGRHNIKIIGKYEFYIDKPEKFLSRVIGLRKYYSKQELIEQIRMYIIKSIEKRIEFVSKDDYIDSEIINNFYLEQNELVQNEFDKKMLEYGIILNSFNIEKIETV